jgi:LacI family transcriptional regulator
MKEPPMVTVHDVARVAGVSISTVSRALSDPDRVAPATRQKVRTAADELGYRPNRAASSLRAGRAGAYGLVVPDLANPYFATVAKGAQERARERGYGLFVVDTEENPDLEAEAMHTLGPQTDGVVLCSPRAVDRALAAAEKRPVVLVNHAVDGVAAVGADHAAGMRRAVEHLRALGHHRIAYVGGPSSSWSDQARRAGLAAAAARHDDVEVVELGAFRPQVEGGQAAADLVVATGATAVITFNDLVAVGLVDRLRARRLRVPDDFSVVGCDDSYVASLVDPPLTTLRVDLRALGRAAVDQLVASAPGSPAPHLPPLDVDLVVRSSTAPPTAPPVDRGEP